MVVPLAPTELAKKIDAIYKHQSQVGSRQAQHASMPWGSMPDSKSKVIAELQSHG